MDNRTVPLAFRTDDPALPVDVTNFAQPLIANENGAQWSALVDPLTSSPVNTQELPNAMAPGARGLITASALYGADAVNDTERAIAMFEALPGDGTFAQPFFNALGVGAALLLADDVAVGTGNFNTASLANLLADAQDFDGLVPPVGCAMAQAFGLGFTGVTGTYDRYRVASATNLATLTSQGVQLATAPGEWTLTHVPVANTIATVTRAAGAAGVRHVLRSINATLVGVAAIAAPISVVVRDGATGVGPILWADQLFAPAAGSQDRVTLTGLNIVGSDATAMTLEFIAAPGATNFEAVAATGFDAVT